MTFVQQRAGTVMFLRVENAPRLVSPLIVTLTRIAPRPLDSDNLQAAFKACRDGVADYFGVDDRDPRITWRYGQERGKAKEYAVRIDIIAPATDGREERE